MQPNEHWEDLKNLVLVAGHAVYVADNFDHPADNSSWFLQSFQQGEAPFYIEHIRAGVELADKDKESLLVFSGGQTRMEAGPRSEAHSYWSIANHFHWWGQTSVCLRATTEEYARDSFENLLFGICRFWECVGRYPDVVTVVSWAFKEQRFDLHRDAIRFPGPPRYCFVGVNQPVNLALAIEEEKNNTLDPFGVDPYGTGAAEFTKPDGKIVNLGKKRDARNPMRRTHPYASSCPNLAALLQHKGPGFFDNPFLWKAQE